MQGETIWPLEFISPLGTHNRGIDWILRRLINHILKNTAWNWWYFCPVQVNGPKQLLCQKVYYFPWISRKLNFIKVARLTDSSVPKRSLGAYRETSNNWSKSTRRNKIAANLSKFTLRARGYDPVWVLIFLSPFTATYRFNCFSIMEVEVFSRIECLEVEKSTNDSYIDQLPINI